MPFSNDVLRFQRRRGNTAKVSSYRGSIIDPHGFMMQERPGIRQSAASGVLWGAGVGTLGVPLALALCMRRGDIESTFMSALPICHTGGMDILRDKGQCRRLRCHFYQVVHAFGSPHLG